MPTATPSWNSVRVHGKWVNQDGSMKPGSWKLTMPFRVTNATDDVIIPLGLIGSGSLNVTPGLPSVDIQAPCHDDPDNFPQNVQPVLEITFLDAPGERYVLDTPLALAGDANGVDLANVILTDTLPIPAEVFIRGVPGGLAELDAQGFVLDASGNRVTGGAAGALIATNNLSDVPNKATARGNLGLGTASTQPTSAFATPSDLTALSATFARRVSVASPTGVAATDTAAVVDAQNRLRALGGGVLEFQQGTYVINKDTLAVESFWHITGQGRGATVIKLANGQNGALFQTAGYAAALAANTGGGPYQWSLKDLTLDGNKANQTSGTGALLYGCAFVLQDLVIRDCKGLGIDSTWNNGAGFVGGFDVPIEPMVRNIDVAACDGGGIKWGNNDSSFDRVFVFYCGPNSGTSTTVGLDLTAAAQGCELTSCHVYGNQHKYAYRVSATACYLTQCQGEGAQDTQLLLLASQCTVMGGMYFGAGSYTSVHGIQVGDGTTIYPELLSIDTQLSNCNGGALHTASEGANNRYRLSIFQTTGTVFTGTPLANRQITYTVKGAAAVGNSGAASTPVGGWTPGQNSLLAASMDPALANTSTVLPSGALILAKVPVETPITISNVLIYLATAGATLTAGGNLLGIYNSAGTLIGRTADQSTAWTTTGVKTAAVTAESGQSLSVGGAGQYVYVGFLSNGTTPAKPQNGNLGPSALLNIGLSNQARAYFGPTGQTTLPASFSLLSSVHDKLYFAALT